MGNQKTSSNWMLEDIVAILLKHKSGMVDKELCEKLAIDKIEYGITCISQMYVITPQSDDLKKWYDRLVEDLRKQIVKLGGTPKDVVIVTSDQDKIISHSDLLIDVSSKTVRRAGQIIHLTKKRYEVLLLLMRNRGTMLSIGQILDYVWKDVIVSESSVRVTVSMLNKVLGENLITNKKGYGYIIP